MFEFKQIDLNSRNYLMEKQLREDILRKPLGLILSDEDIRFDHLFKHFGVFHGIELIACCMAKEAGDGVAMMRQVCVKEAYQSQKVGSFMMKQAESQLKILGYDKIVLHARVSAWTFYQKLGYVFESDSFEEIGVEHRIMSKVLD